MDGALELAIMRVVHCGGMPPASLESLLFGHEKGAFAGAFDRQTGLIEYCDGGTLILVDVDRLPADQQQRLAGVLASGIVRPTGASHGFKIDLRIFATSTLPLDKLTANGVDHVKTRDLPFTEIKVGVVRISKSVTTLGIKNST